MDRTIEVPHGIFPPACEPHLDEMARLLPQAYATLFRARVAMSEAIKARGMVGGGLAALLAAEQQKINEASAVIGLGISHINNGLRRFEGM